MNKKVPEWATTYPYYRTAEFAEKVRKHDRYVEVQRMSVDELKAEIFRLDEKAEDTYPDEL